MSSVCIFFYAGWEVIDCKGAKAGLLKIFCRWCADEIINAETPLGTSRHI